MTKNTSTILFIPITDDYMGWMGGIVYLENLIKCFELGTNLADGIDLYLVNCSSHPDAEIIRQFGAHDFIRGIGRSDGSMVQTGAGMAKELPNPDAIFPVLYSEQIRSQFKKPIYWIPDFQHRRLPHLFPADEIATRDRCMQAIAAADGVLWLSSNAAKNDFLEFYPGGKVMPLVWSFCSLLTPEDATAQDPRQTFGLPEKYLYIPNQFWKHKDHLTAFRALALLRETGIEASLVCTGSPGDYRDKEYFSELQDYLRDQDLARSVKIIGLIPRAEQLAILRFAAAVVQPSLFEGWSTVVEDARAIGRPIFLSDIPVHREQAPERAIYFRAGDAGSLTDRIASVWNDLGSGPDLAAEAAARQNSNARQQRTVANLIETIAIAVDHLKPIWGPGAADPADRAVMVSTASYDLGLPVDFTLSGNSTSYSIIGLSEPQAEGRWTHDEYASITLPLAAAPPAELSLRLRATPFLVPSSRGLAVTVLANGFEIGRFDCDQVREFDEVFAFDTAACDLHQHMRVALEIVGAASPAAAGLADDHRLLGLLIHELTIYPADEAFIAAGREMYSLGTPIDFTASGNSLSYSIVGMSQPEPPGRWTCAEAAGIELRLPTPAPAELSLRLRATPFPVPGRDGLTVTVKVNEREIGRFVCREAKEFERVFTVDAVACDVHKRIHLVFEITGAVRPIDAGLSADHRLLGLLFTELALLQIPGTRI